MKRKVTVILWAYFKLSYSLTSKKFTFKFVQLFFHQNNIKMNDKEYKKWEKQVAEAKKSNKELLVGFEKWLKEKSLKPNTISNHVGNIDFYADAFLLRYDVILAENGALEIGMFLGDYFIRKVMWASKYTIQENIASLKKFYTFLNEIGKTSDNDLKAMKQLIKEEKSEWLEEVESYWNN